MPITLPKAIFLQTSLSHLKICEAKITFFKVDNYTTFVAILPEIFIIIGVGDDRSMKIFFTYREKVINIIDLR